MRARSPTETGTKWRGDSGEEKREGKLLREFTQQEYRKGMTTAWLSS